jgi:hypothetical protein
LNVLHHVNDPIATLDKLIQLTDETLILEVASLGARDRRKLRLSPWQTWFLARLPVMVVGSRHSDQTFFFTRSGMTNLLKCQRHHFAEVRIMDSEFKDRFIVVARRRRINHLVVVAGPTSAGKSALIKAITSHQLPELVAALGIENLKEWRVADANAVAELSEPYTQGLILHYDFLRPYKRRSRSYRDDKAFHLLEAAREIFFVTLWTPPPRLERQLLEGELRTPQLRRRHRHLLQIYRQPSEVLKFYDEWLEFCGTRASKMRKHLVVEFNRSLKIYSPEEWKDTVRNDEPGSE